MRTTDVWQATRDILPQQALCRDVTAADRPAAVKSPAALLTPLGNLSRTATPSTPGRHQQIAGRINLLTVPRPRQSKPAGRPARFRHSLKKLRVELAWVLRETAMRVFNVKSIRETRSGTNDL